MKVKLLKPVYLNSTLVLEGSVVEAKLEGGYVFLEYKTCCTTGTRRLEPEEFEIYEQPNNE